MPPRPRRRAPRWLGPTPSRSPRPTVRLLQHRVVRRQGALRPAGGAAAALQPARLARDGGPASRPALPAARLQAADCRPGTTGRRPTPAAPAGLRRTRWREARRSASLSAPVAAAAHGRTGTRRPIRPRTTCSPSRRRRRRRPKPGCGVALAATARGRAGQRHAGQGRRSPRSSSSPRSSWTACAAAAACDPDDYNPLLLRGRVAVPHAARRR